MNDGNRSDSTVKLMDTNDPDSNFGSVIGSRKQTKLLKKQKTIRQGEENGILKN